MSSPELHLHTAYILNDEGRIISTREPGAQRGPLFTLARSTSDCRWAIRSDLATDVARELDRLAADEQPIQDLRDPPIHAATYISLLASRIESCHDAVSKTDQSDGPLFAFPAQIAQPTGIVLVDDERQLEHHFRGWAPGEIAEGRAPVLAIVEDRYPVSVCFCARRSNEAAEAGLETAKPFRGRGYGPRVAGAWALAIRSTGRIPLYSTAWSNTASLAVARKLGLTPYASHWSLED